LPRKNGKSNDSKDFHKNIEQRFLLFLKYFYGCNIITTEIFDPENKRVYDVLGIRYKDSQIDKIYLGEIKTTFQDFLSGYRRGQFNILLPANSLRYIVCVNKDLATKIKKYIDNTEDSNLKEYGILYAYALNNPNLNIRNRKILTVTHNKFYFKTLKPASIIKNSPRDSTDFEFLVIRSVTSKLIESCENKILTATERRNLRKILFKK